MATRVLNPETTGKFLACVRREALEAGLRRIIVVAAPGQDREIRNVWPEEMDRYDDVEVRVQDKAAPGLGEAILCGARSLYDGESFALMMPDEFPDSEPVMKPLLDQHERTRGCVFSLFGDPDQKDSPLQGHSVANCLLGNDGFARITRLIDESEFEEEKKKGRRNQRSERLHVFGRYVLTYDFIDALKRERDELRRRENLSGRAGAGQKEVLGFTTLLDRLLRPRGREAGDTTTPAKPEFSGYLLKHEPKIIPANLRRELMIKVGEMIVWCSGRYS